MRLILLFTFLTTILSSNIFAQMPEGVVSIIDTHEHRDNDIGIAISPVYFINEKALSYAMHIHYTHYIPKTKFGVGISFERIFLAPKHSTFGLVTAYMPIEGLSFMLSPGITFEDGNPNSLFSLHIETTYEFEIGRFHIGPAFEFAYDPNDQHVSLGIHVGYGF